jgi:branched-chain amino acid transport system substrate-binding protein
MTALIACLAVLAAGADGGAIKVGGYYPLTGSYAATGIVMRNAAQLAAAEINAAGGVLGKKLVILDGDDQTKAATGAQVVKDFVEKEHVVGIIGPANTHVAEASTSTANERHVPHIVSNAVGNKVNELFKDHPQNYVFRLAASEQVQSHMIVTEAFAARGRRKPAILHDDAAHGMGASARLKALLAQRGVTPVYDGALKVGEKDATAHVQAARDAGADVILLFAFAKEGATVTRALEKIGWKPEIIGSSSLSSSDFTKASGPYGEGTLIPQTVIETDASEPAAVHFFEAYRKAYATANVEPAPGAAQTYDAVHLLARAIQQAGSTDGAKIKAALEDLGKQYDGATGEYFKPWSADDHEAVSPANMVWGMIKDGRVVPAPAPATAH